MSSVKSTVTSHAVSLGAGIVVGLIISFQMKDVLLGIATGVMSTLVSENLIYILVVHRAEKQELLEKISERMKNIVRHAALFTRNNSFENAIGLFNEVQGSAVWILAKVISEKLSSAFEGGRDIRLLNFDGPSYSEFARTLYGECDKSIYLTWPDTPKAWFHDAIKKPDVLKQLQETHSIDESDYPPHIKSLRACNVSKERLVIIPDSKWDQFCGEEKPFRTCFEKLSEWANIYIRYVKESDFIRTFLAFGAYDLAKTDFAFFDNSIQLIWSIEKEENGRKIGSLSLRVNPEEGLIRAFNFADHEDIYHTPKEIDSKNNVETSNSGKEV